MNRSNMTVQSILLTSFNSTMFTHSAPLAPADGIWGEVVPFNPPDACGDLQPSKWTRSVGSSLQFDPIGPYPHVVALVARGKCTFEEKFDYVDNVPNVIGLIMYDYEHGDDLSNDIEIATSRQTSIPGFLIPYSVGMDLLESVEGMRASYTADSTKGAAPSSRARRARATAAAAASIPPGSIWVKATLRYIGLSGPIASIIQFALLIVIVFLTLAFAVSIYMHYHIYRLQRLFSSRRQGSGEDRSAISIDEAFMEKLPVRRYIRGGNSMNEATTVFEASAAGVSAFRHDGGQGGGASDGASSSKDAAEGGGMTSAPEGVLKTSNGVVVDAPTSEGNDGDRAPIEADEYIIHAHAPPNEMCPICLDDFEHLEVLNELPCGHFYHISCIQPWLLNRSPCCPMCKEDVREAFAEASTADGQRPLLGEEGGPPGGDDDGRSRTNPSRLTLIREHFGTYGSKLREMFSISQWSLSSGRENNRGSPRAERMPPSMGSSSPLASPSPPPPTMCREGHGGQRSASGMPAMAVIVTPSAVLEGAAKASSVKEAVATGARAVDDGDTGIHHRARDGTLHEVIITSGDGAATGGKV